MQIRHARPGDEAQLEPVVEALRTGIVFAGCPQDARVATLLASGMRREKKVYYVMDIPA